MNKAARKIDIRIEMSFHRNTKAESSQPESNSIQIQIAAISTIRDIVVVARESAPNIYCNPDFKRTIFRFICSVTSSLS